MGHRKHSAVWDEALTKRVDRAITRHASERVINKDLVATPFFFNLGANLVLK
jgi:hypothetical protein